MIFVTFQTWHPSKRSLYTGCSDVHFHLIVWLSEPLTFDSGCSWQLFPSIHRQPPSCSQVVGTAVPDSSQAASNSCWWIPRPISPPSPQSAPWPPSCWTCQEHLPRVESWWSKLWLTSFSGKLFWLLWTKSFGHGCEIPCDFHDCNAKQTLLSLQFVIAVQGLGPSLGC